MTTQSAGRVRHVVAGNAAAYGVFYATQTVAAIVSVPFLLHRFGVTAYGLFALVAGLLALLQVMNLGLITATMKKIAEVSAEGVERINQVASTCYLLAFVGNTVASLAMVAAGSVGARYLGVTAQNRHTFLLLAVVMAATLLANGLLQVPRGILAGHQRFGLLVRLDLFNAVGPLVAMAVTVALSSGIVVFVLVNQLTTIVSGLLILRATARVIPGLTRRPRYERGAFRSVLVFNGFQVLNQVADVIFYTSDRLVLQHISGSAVVGDYAIAERPRLLGESLISVPLTAVIPAVSKASAAGDTTLVERFILSGTRMYLRLVLPPLLVVIVLLPGLFRLWLGQPYVHLARYAQLFVGGLVTAAPFKLFSHTLLGSGRVKEVVLTKSLFAPINVAASYLLARQIGIVGVIIPTFAFWAIVYPTLCLLLLQSEQIGAGRFLRSVLGPTAIAVAWGLAVLAVGNSLGHDPAFLQLVLAGLGTVGGYIVSFLTIHDPEERDLAVDVLRRGLRPGRLKRSRSEDARA